MTVNRTPQEARLEKRKARSQSAKKWARGAKLGLFGLCLTAIWQERALSPMVHDQMQTAYVYGVEWLEESESASGYLTAMSGFSGNGNQEEYSAITRALLKLRQ